MHIPNLLLDDIPLECFDPNWSQNYRNYECLINLKRKILEEFTLPRCISLLDKGHGRLCYAKDIDKINGQLIINKKFQSENLRVTFLLFGFLGSIK